MSQENVELVKSIYASWQAGDYAKTDWAAPDIEFRPMPNAPDGEIGRGIDHVRGVWRSFLAEWENVRATAEALTPVGDHVVARTRFSGQGKASGVSMDFMSAAAVFTIERGQVVRLALYGSEHEALEAVGPSG